MAARRELVKMEEPSAGAYLAQPSAHLTFISSGSAVLDCVLGGGWVAGRMSNIIGDKSTAKTGLTIEAMANFARQYPKGPIWHREAESAFDEPYAATMGYPVKRVSKWGDDHDTPLDTVEDVFEDLDTIIEARTNRSGGVPGLYVLDSLDSLSDREEMARDISTASYGQGKAKKLSETFRRLCRKLERTQICVLIVSQVRDNIGVSFGEKYKRSGGKAMDFYASHCLWLANAGTEKKKDRVTAINVKAKCKKNKVGMAFRECEFTYRFGFGIDDLATSAAWLEEIKKLKGATDYDKAKELIEAADGFSDEDYREITNSLGAVVRENWTKIETSILPRRRKYA